MEKLKIIANSLSIDKLLAIILPFSEKGFQKVAFSIFINYFSFKPGKIHFFFFKGWLLKATQLN